MDKIFIKQVEVGELKNFTYILACENTKEALIIDTPKGSEVLQSIIDENGFNLKYIINTHQHLDHIVNNDFFKKNYGAEVLIHMADDVNNSIGDFFIEDNEIIKLGNLNLKIIHTPGHTPGGVCIYIANYLFTGDTLFVGDSGKTDLKGANRQVLGRSIRRLMKLPDDTEIYPGHNYGITKTSTIIWEKRNNINAAEYGFLLK